MRATLGQYQLGRTLGSGVSCKVKVAKDSNGKKHAIKILNDDPIFAELSKQEVLTLKTLNHPNIVNLVDEGSETYQHPKKGNKKVDYIVLELVQGGELFDYVANSGRFQENFCRFYFIQLMEALKHMHNAGFTHRDLKPENMMLDSDFNLKVADFGFACSAKGRKGQGFCTTQLGTQSYMAPEIHLNKPYSGPSVDLFASAIILFVMLTQRPPFTSAHPQDVHYRLLAAERGDLFWKAHDDAEEGPTLFSKEFRDLFQRMTRLNPSQRLTVDQVLQHPWVKGGPVASKHEIRSEFTGRKKLVDEEAKCDRDKKRAERAGKDQKNKVRRGEGNDEGEDENPENEIFLDQDLWIQSREQWPEYESFVAKQTEIFTTGNPSDLVSDLKDWLHKQTVAPEEEDANTFQAAIQEGTFEVDIEKGKIKFAILDQRSFEPVQMALQFSVVDESTLCAEFIRMSGLQAVFFEKFKQIKSDVLYVYNDTTADGNDDQE